MSQGMASGIKSKHAGQVCLKMSTMKRINENKQREKIWHGTSIYDFIEKTRKLKMTLIKSHGHGN